MTKDPNDEGRGMDDIVKRDIVKRLEERFQDFSGVTIKWNGDDLFILFEGYTELGYKRVRSMVDNIIESGDY